MTKFDIVPRGGFVIVGRTEVDPYIKNAQGEYAIGNNGEKLMKHPTDIRIEELMNVYATVFSVGKADPRTGEQFEGVKGQRVIIAPEVFIPIDLDDGDRVWLGPMAGVKAFFVERAEAAWPEEAPPCVWQGTGVERCESCAACKGFD